MFFISLFHNTKVQLYVEKSKLNFNENEFNSLYYNQLDKLFNESFDCQFLEELAISSGFIKRQGGKLTADGFLKAMMFSVNNQKNTSLPDITENLKDYFEIDISKVGLHKRFTKVAVDFLKEVLKMQFGKKFGSFEDESLKAVFSAIKIKDSTKFSLPTNYDGQYPGFGNFSKTNGLMNIQFEYDLISGQWCDISFTKGTRNDQLESKESIGGITNGDLHIRDLAYVSPTYLKAVKDKGGYFLNRLPTQINIYNIDNKLIDWKKVDARFKKYNISIQDLDILIYEKEKISCRLIIEPVSEEEYRRRLVEGEKSSKSQGVIMTELSKIRCRYNTFITNVSRTDLPIKVIRKVYYLRWQIELVFKTWKSYFEINKVKKVKKERLECQLIAGIIWILLNWRLFQAYNNYIKGKARNLGVSILKFFKKCKKYSETLKEIILKPKKLENWLLETFFPLMRSVICEAQKKTEKTHYQIVNELIYG